MSDLANNDTNCPNKVEYQINSIFKNIDMFYGTFGIKLKCYRDQLGQFEQFFICPFSKNMNVQLTPMCLYSYYSLCTVSDPVLQSQLI